MHNIEKTNLFNGEILDDNQSWQSFVRSTEAFMPLIKHIYEINNMKFDDISYITIASNAVFRIGDKVIKIFYPPEASFRYGLNYEIYEYETELAVMNHAKNAGVLIPDIIHNGMIKDGKYSFGYIIMNYIDGISAREAIPNFNDSEKREFALKLKKEMDKLTIANADIKIPPFDKPVILFNSSWDEMTLSFRDDRKLHIKNARFPEVVVSHTDLNGQNIIIDKQGRVNLLDFAETVAAPYYYNWFALLLLFNYDKVMIKEYFGECESDEFFETLTMSFLLRNVKWIFNGEPDIDMNNIISVNQLKNILIKWFNNKIK